MELVMDMLKALVAAGIDFTFSADPSAPTAAAPDGSWELIPVPNHRNTVMLWQGNNLQRLSTAEAVAIICNI